MSLFRSFVWGYNILTSTSLIRPNICNETFKKGILLFLGQSRIWYFKLWNFEMHWFRCVSSRWDALLQNRIAASAAKIVNRNAEWGHKKFLFWLNFLPTNVVSQWKSKPKFRIEWGWETGISDNPPLNADMLHFLFDFARIASNFANQAFWKKIAQFVWSWYLAEQNIGAIPSFIL